jgi:hypothetical protein
MASELRVNTLKDASGNNSIGMSYVAEGSAKQWAKTNAAGTTVNDSFNLSSLTDRATGNQGYNLTNNMGNSNYSIILTVNDQSNYYIFERAITYVRSTSQYTGAAYSDTSVNYVDAAQGSQLNGDLA